MQDAFTGQKIKFGKKTCTCDFAFVINGSDVVSSTGKCYKKCTGGPKTLKLEGVSGNYTFSFKTKNGKVTFPSIAVVPTIIEPNPMASGSETEGDIIGVEFAIGPPPSDSLGEFFPEEFTYTTPDTSGTTLNPAYTTVPLPTEATTAWVEPEGYVNFEKLQEVTSTLVNAFQTGELTIEGANITGLGLEKPVSPPEAPPPYTSPEERNQITELTYAEQVALNNSLLLEVYAPKAFDVPEALAMAGQPEEGAEMQVLDTFEVYARDTKGKMITELGDAADPWTCTVSVLSGPGGAVMGTTTVDFVAGLATFDDLYITEAGADYILQFEVSYPTTGVVSVSSLAVTVAGRPLGMQITEEAPLVPQNTTFSVSATIWDMALDQAAEASVLSAFVWDCTVSLASGSLGGNLEKTLDAGQNTITFDDLIVEQPGLSYDLDVTCVTTDGNTTVSAMSAPFHVHDFPTTGSLAVSGTNFVFKGALKAVEDILKNFNSAMGTATCNGCPPGMV